MKKLLGALSALALSSCVCGAYDQWCKDHPGQCEGTAGGGSAQGGGSGGATGGGNGGAQGGGSGGGNAQGGGSGGAQGGGNGGAQGGGSGGGTTGGLSIDQSTFDFGALNVNAVSSPVVFKVTNGSGASIGPLTTMGSSPDAGGTDFDVADTCQGQTLAAMQSCTLSVSFAPKSGGLKTMTLVTGAGTMTVSVGVQGNGVAAGNLTGAPTSHDFGAYVLGDSSAPFQFTIRNTGATSGTLTVAVQGVHHNDFTPVLNGCAGMTLPMNGTCTVQLVFIPSAVGSRVASLTVTEGGMVRAAIALGGEGLASGALTLDPPTQAYTDVPPAMTQTHDFTLTNTGNSTTGVISTRLRGADAQYFTLLNDRCDGATLAATRSCTLSVRVAPGAPGSFLATLLATASPGGGASSNLTGNALAPAILSISPTMGGFGSVGVNTPAMLPFTVTNTGGVASGAVNVSVSGTDLTMFNAVSNCGAALMPAQLCTGTVTFTPTSTGMKSASLVVTGGAGVMGSIPLTGTGLPPGSLTVNPMSQPYGGLLINSTSAASSFTVTNADGGPTPALFVSLEGNNPSDFLIADGGCQGTTLNPGNMCTVGVSFRPSARGARSAQLKVDGMTAGAITSTLTGQGLAQASFDSTLTSVQLGDVVQGGTANVTFPLHNAGDLFSSAVSATLTGATSPSFAIGMNGCTSGIDGGATCNVRVDFNPTATELKGPASATLNLTATTGGTLMVPVNANVLNKATLTAQDSSPYDYGNVTVMSSKQFDFTFKNLGEVPTPMGVSAALMTPTGTPYSIAAGGTCSSSTPLPQNGFCTVRVVLQPTGTGTFGNTLLVTSGALSASVVLTGSGAVGALQLTPNPVNMGTVTIGGTPPDSVQSVTVKNIGGGSTNTLNVSLSGSSEMSLDASSNCQGTTLASMMTCHVDIRFRPLGSMSGARTATLTVTDTAQPTMPATASVNGVGQLNASLSGPAALDLGVAGGMGGSTTADWVVNNDGDVMSGAPTITGPTNSAFTVMSNGCGVAIPAHTSCRVTLKFAPAATGTVSGTAMLSASPGGSTTVTLTGTGGYTLTVMKQGNGSGNVTDNLGGISCPAGCNMTSAAYAPGAQLTLSAANVSNSGFFFAGFGPPCPPGAKRSCTLLMNANITVNANFKPISGLVFVSSTTYAPVQAAGVSFFDSQCAALAQSVGLDNPSIGTWQALMLTSTAPRTSFGGWLTAGGYYRMDGLPFLTVAGGLADIVYNPLRYDEQGNDTQTALYFTGDSGSSCNNWLTASTSSVDTGVASGGPVTWRDEYLAPNCMTAVEHIACWIAKTGLPAIPLPPAPNGSKKVWSLPHSPNGTTSPDQDCQMHRPTGVTNAHALILQTSNQAMLPPMQLYARPDGAVVGTGQDIESLALLQSGFWQDCTNGACPQYVTNRPRVWVGGNAAYGNATSGTQSCSGWTVANSTQANTGAMSETDARFWVDSTLTCNLPGAYIYCFEQ